MYNANFWKPRFLNDFVPAVRRVEDTFLNRILPTFSKIDSESEAFAERLWNDAMSQPYYEDGPDEADIADAVRDAEISHYLGLKGMEQGLLNCCALFLYHLYEQQLMTFHRQELLDWRKKDDSSLFSHKEVQKRLERANVDIHKFSVWPKLEELRCLANTIKHGEGKSSQELLAIAPHLFSSSALTETAIHGIAMSGRVYAPLVGDDIYVNHQQIGEYADAIEGFWLELATSLGAI
jgi:hypothetical protein